MVKNLLLICCVTFGLSTFGQTKIEYQNKRLLSSLKKIGISEFSKLEEMQFFSKEPIEQTGKFFKVENDSDRSGIKYVFVGRVNSCRAGGCCNGVNISGNTESEFFDYFIFFDSKKTVMFVDVYNYQATHGYEVTAKGWLKQFTGFSGEKELIVNKDIDGISGATVSVFAITADIQEKTRLLRSVN